MLLAYKENTVPFSEVYALSLYEFVKEYGMAYIFELDEPYQPDGKERSAAIIEYSQASLGHKYYLVLGTQKEKTEFEVCHRALYYSDEDDEIIPIELPDESDDVVFYGDDYDCLDRWIKEKVFAFEADDYILPVYTNCSRRFHDYIYHETIITYEKDGKLGWFKTDGTDTVVPYYLKRMRAIPGVENIHAYLLPYTKYKIDRKSNFLNLSSLKIPEPKKLGEVLSYLMTVPALQLPSVRRTSMLDVAKLTASDDSNSGLLFTKKFVSDFHLLLCAAAAIKETDDMERLRNSAAPVDGIRWDGERLYSEAEEYMDAPGASEEGRRVWWEELSFGTRTQILAILALYIKYNRQFRGIDLEGYYAVLYPNPTHLRKGDLFTFMCQLSATKELWL